MPFRTGLVSVNGLFREALSHLLNGSVVDIISNESSLRRVFDDVRRKGRSLELLLAEMPNDRAMFCENFVILRREYPNMRSLILDVDFDFGRLCWAYGQGTDGVLLTSVTCDALIESIVLLSRGEKVFPSSLAGMLANWAKKTEPERYFHAKTLRRPLSERECDVISYLVDGLPNKKIAYALGITESTVKLHLKSVQKKMGAANRTQIAVWALECGLASTSTPAAINRGDD